MPTIDKGIAGVIIGPIVGLLVMKGLVAPADANMVTQNIDALVGGLIALISIVGYFEHAIQKEKTKSLPSSATTTTTTEVVVPSDPVQPAT